jgi:hypothetical protein
MFFFIVGGFCVGMQVLVAFLWPDGAANYALLLAYFTAIAAPFLALGTWLSPGRRWRELGLTILIGAGVCVGSFSTTIFLPDENGVMVDRARLAPYLALAPGYANSVVVFGAGLLLYLRGGGGKPMLIGRAVRDVLGEIELTVRASVGGMRRK